jgi:serine/threonine protein kinase
MNSSQSERPDDNGRSAAVPADFPDDPRLLEAVQEYLAELETGRRPNRQDFLRRYADVAGPLAQCLDGLDLVHHAAIREKPTLTSSTAPGTKPADGVPANPLGDFQIVREIGRGGMGIVYEAVQLSLGRLVALKVLPFAAAFDSKHLQRFKNEAQAAAQLHHTNIVPVYFVGSERGVHYYAMQLIEGQSLAALIKQLRQEAGRAAPDEDAAHTAQPEAAIKSDLSATFRPRPALSSSRGLETLAQASPVLSTQPSGRSREFFRTASRLIIQAAEALEHAHQNGIVHRDIKPANLLVDAQGRLWITDFGLAQFHADAGLTQTGDLLGTLRYMSPEQASGRRVLLDHRTDVYALGATLYELVTLEPIFPGQNRHELLYQITNEEPRAPRVWDKTIPVELETIILKAVAKNPAERYQTAQELADDLRRYLADEPIRARRPTLWERARKWSRRHPSVVAAAVLVLLVCIAGLLVNNRMIADEQAKTQSALQNEQQRARQAKQAVDALVQVVEDELPDIPPLEATRTRLLEMALGYYQDFLAERRGDAHAEKELAAGEARVRRILDDLTALHEGADRIWIVRQPAVQQELGLDETPKGQITALWQRWDHDAKPLFRGRHGPGRKENEKKLAALVRASEEELDAILGDQRVRLRQIALQFRGTRAFHDHPVITALHLTARQQEQIRAIEGEMFARMTFGPPWKSDRDERGKPRNEAGKKVVIVMQKPVFVPLNMFEATQNAVKRITANVLTAKQAVRWRELVGRPSAAARAMMFPPGPPGGHHRPGPRPADRLEDRGPPPPLP